MPLYNKEREVSRAIHSVLSQTIRDFELIVVNDGSTDKGPEIVRAFGSRVRIIDKPNAGVSSARNRGISAAKADIVAFIDADDEWAPDFLETIMSLRDKFPSCDVFATNYVFKRTNDYGHQTIIRGLPRGFTEGILADYFRVASQSDPPLWTSAVAVRKKAIDVVGGFPVGVTAGEDLITWARLSARYKIAYSIKPKAYFWEPEIVSEYPRIPQTPDVVGEQLSLLLSEHVELDGLREYVALWHRMRANIFIRIHKRREARSEICRALSYSGSTIKLYLFAILTLFPSSAAKHILKLFKLFKETKLIRSG